MPFNLSELPEKERVLVVQAGNSSPISRDMAIAEATVRNTLATNELKVSMEKADKSNKSLTKWLIFFTVILIFLTAILAAPSISSFFYWCLTILGNVIKSLRK